MQSFLRKCHQAALVDATKAWLVIPAKAGIQLLLGAPHHCTTCAAAYDPRWKFVVIVRLGAAKPCANRGESRTVTHRERGANGKCYPGIDARYRAAAAMVAGLRTVGEPRGPDCNVGPNASERISSHEIGHEEHRHVLRSVLQSSAVVLIGAHFTGDVSSASTLVVAVPTFLLDSHYSRDFSRNRGQSTLFSKEHSDPTSVSMIVAPTRGQKPTYSRSILSIRIAQ
jgi:hypothetical protein